MSYVRYALAATVATLLFHANAHAQPKLLDVPRISPAASASQRLGLTDITVNYHRPGVKGRRIWGALVPYNEIWRAGANENTTITFSSPVIIAGRKIDTGTYGLHVLVEEKQWTLILSSQNKLWGSFNYDESEDVVRVTAVPQPIEFHERLTYTFNHLTEHSLMLALRWERLMGAFRIEVDVRGNVVQTFRDELRGQAGFGWQAWHEAAEWCMETNTNLDEALDWIDTSISWERNFSNMRVKAGILERKDRPLEAEAIIRDAIDMATPFELEDYGDQLMALGRIDRAIEVFQRNVVNYPDVWLFYDSLGEAYVRKGDAALAIENYNKALSLARDERQKNRIRGILANLR